MRPIFDNNIYTSTGAQVEATFEGLAIVLDAIDQIKQYPLNVVQIELHVVMSDVKIFGEHDRQLTTGTKEPRTLEI